MTHRIGFAREFFRYAVVGGISFLLDWALLALGVALGVHYLAATAGGFLAGLVCCFVLSVGWVWRGTRARDLHAFLMFGLIGLAGMGLTMLLMWLVSGLGGARPELAKPFISGVVLLWDFLLRRSLVFHR